MFRNLVHKRYLASTVKQKITKHFKSNDENEILSKFPSHFHKISHKNKPNAVYVANQKAAQTIVDSIRRFHKANVPFFEVNPGPCILTECLLSELLKIELYLIESNSEFDTIQKKLVASTNEILGYHTSFNDLAARKTIEFIMSNIQENHSWHEEIVGQIFQIIIGGATTNTMIRHVIGQNRLFSNGRIEMFALMPKFEYNRLMADPTSGYHYYTRKSCLFQILFECEKLNEILTKQMLPWWYPKIPRLYKNVKNDQEIFYLTRITPRANLLTTICAKDDLSSLNFFVDQCFFKRKAYIIPKFEQWAPGIGKDLITYHPQSRADMNSNEFYNDQIKLASIDVFTEFGMLTPSQILSLFKVFKNSSHYKNSSFHRLLKEKSTKIEQN